MPSWDGWADTECWCALESDSTGTPGHAPVSPRFLPADLVQAAVEIEAADPYSLPMAVVQLRRHDS